MSFLGGGLQLSGQAFYVGDDGTHQLIPQGRGPLFGGLHTLFDYTRPWCELCKVLFNVGDSMVECVSAIPFPSSPPLLVTPNR